MTCADRRSGWPPIVWIGILLSVFQQFVGINVIFYYSTTLWRSVGFSESDSLTITVITSVTNIVVTLVAIAIVDKVGEKPMLLIGSAGMAVTLATMAVCFSQAIGDADAVKLPDPSGQHRPRRRKPVRRLLRSDVGAGRLGAAG